MKGLREASWPRCIWQDINMRMQPLNVKRSSLREYSLLTRYADNFLPVGENGDENIFEIGTVAAQVVGPGASPFNMIQVCGEYLGWGFNMPVMT